MKKIPVIVVCGATASGKTSLAINLAKEYNGEVISADSMQIYKGMDIGTAKPSIEEMDGIIHHMIDVCDITDIYNVSDYCDAAHKVIEDVYNRKKIPIVCGGTGLYIDSLINDIDFSESTNNEEIRKGLIDYAEENGSEKLYEMLQHLDPVAAQSIHSNNIKRVIRAIEHIKLTGELFSEYKKNAAGRESRYNPIWLMIDMDREILYDRINRRVDIMAENGLEDEARKIYNMNLPDNLTSLCGIGYKELFEYFKGNCSRDEAFENIKQNSRRYAKRQLTWFRRNRKINYLNFNDSLMIQAKKIIGDEFNGKIYI